MRVVSFQFVFKEVNNEVITMQDLRSALTEFYFVRTMNNEQHIFFYKIYIFHFTKL